MARSHKRASSARVDTKQPASAGAAKPPQDDLSPTVRMILEESGPENLQAVDWLAANGRYLSGEDLAIVIEANPGSPLPDQLRDYLCRFLRGKVHRKRGPKGSDRSFKYIIELLAAQEYRKVLQRLQKEARPRGREAIARGVLTPHEEAIKIVQERFAVRFGKRAAGRVANILSSHN